MEYYDSIHNYCRAAELLEELVPVFKGTERAEVLYYTYAWSEYKCGDIILSQYHFKNFTRQFPNSDKAEECYFMNAYCYFLNSPAYSLDQTYTKNAIKEMQSFVDMFPDSRRVDSCNMIIDQLRFKLAKKDFEIVKQYAKLDNWKSAIMAAKNFLKEYPGSTFEEEAYFTIINSYYLLAQNSIPSKKAERLNGAIENYVKFSDMYPKSSYLSRAENIYENCKRLKNKL